VNTKDTKDTKQTSYVVLEGSVKKVFVSSVSFVFPRP